MKQWMTWALVPASVLVLLVAGTVSPPREEALSADDRQEIIDHIHSIFQAYIGQDLEAIRATHSADWTGFKTSSRGIIRGLDGYMEDVTFANPMIAYEIEDVEIQLFGDVAVVYYVAEWKNHLLALDEVVTLKARAADVYERRTEGWIQVGSNINVLQAANVWANPACNQCFEVRMSKAEE